MKVSLYILALVVASAALASASPQRGLRSFSRRRQSNDEARAAEETAGLVAEDVEPEPQRFKPSIKRTGSFRPKSSSPVTPVEISPSLPVAVPSDSTPAKQQPARPRTRGSKNFLESIKTGRVAGLNQKQVEVITTGILDQPRTRPSTRPQSGGLKLSGRPSSSRSPSSSSVSRPSRPVNLKKPEILNTTPAAPEITTAAPKAGKNKNESTRRQRVIKLRNRNRAGRVQKKGKMMEDMPMEEEIVADVDPKTAMANEKPVDQETSKKMEIKLDDQVDLLLDKAVKEAKMEEKPKQMKAQEKLPALDEGSEAILDAAQKDMGAKVEDQPSTTTSAPSTPITTTTEAGSPRKRISSISRLRSQQTRTNKTPRAQRNRASRPVQTASRPESSAATPSASRTGSSSSRGQAAQATPTRASGRRSGSFTPRVSSRNRVRPVPEVEVSEAPEEEVQSSRRIRRKLPPVTRRQLPSLSARFAKVKLRRRIAQTDREDDQRVGSSVNQLSSAVSETIPSDENPEIPSNDPDTKDDHKTIGEQIDEASEIVPNRSLRGRRIDSTRRVGRPLNRNLFRDRKKQSPVAKPRTRPTPRTRPAPRTRPTPRTRPAPRKTTLKPRKRFRKPIRFQPSRSSKPRQPSTAKPDTQLESSTPAPAEDLSVVTSPSATTSGPEMEPTTEAIDQMMVVTSKSSVVEGFNEPQEEIFIPSTATEITGLIVNEDVVHLSSIESETSSTTFDGILLDKTTEAATERITRPPRTTTERITRPETTTERITRPPTTPERITRPPTTTEIITRPPTTTEIITRPPTTTERITRPPTTTERITRPPTTTERITRPPTTTERITRPPTTTERITRPPTTVGRRRLRPLTVRPNSESPSSTKTERISLKTTTTTEKIQTTTQAPSTRKPQGIRVAPEDPRDAVNRGGLKFRPHEDSERDIKRTRTGEVIVTQIGTLENTPQDEVRMILSGFGGRRRGLSRPSKKVKTMTTTTESPPFPDISLDDYYYYDEYEYPQLSDY